MNEFSKMINNGFTRLYETEFQTQLSELCSFPSRARAIHVVAGGALVPAGTTMVTPDVDKQELVLEI